MGWDIILSRSHIFNCYGIRNLSVAMTACLTHNIMSYVSSIQQRWDHNLSVSWCIDHVGSLKTGLEKRKCGSILKIAFSRVLVEKENDSTKDMPIFWSAPPKEVLRPHHIRLLPTTSSTSKLFPLWIRIICFTTRNGFTNSDWWVFPFCSQSCEISYS